MTQSDANRWVSLTLNPSYGDERGRVRWVSLALNPSYDSLPLPFLALIAAWAAARRAIGTR